MIPSRIRPSEADVLRRWPCFWGLIGLLVVVGGQLLAVTADPPLQGIRIQARATLAGTVTLKGPPPPGMAAANAALQAQIAAGKDGDFCLTAPQAQKEQQKWIIGPQGGIANVAVFLKPEPGYYLELTEQDLKPYQPGGSKNEAVLDQPFCAFLPHVLLAFPMYYKEGKLVPSGQVVKIKNSSPVTHYARWGGTAKNSGQNLVIESRDESVISVVPDRIAVPVTCGAHAWMEGYIWALDTPFVAVTNRDGAFEIKNAPAGVKLRLFAWHDSGWISQGALQGEPIQLDANKVVERKFSVSVPTQP